VKPVAEGEVPAVITGSRTDEVTSYAPRFERRFGPFVSQLSGSAMVYRLARPVGLERRRPLARPTRGSPSRQDDAHISR
jgi:hypothetical protein